MRREAACKTRAQTLGITLLLKARVKNASTVRLRILQDLRRFRRTFSCTVRPARQGVCVLTGVRRSSPAGFASRWWWWSPPTLLHFLLLCLLLESPLSSIYEEYGNRHGDVVEWRRKTIIIVTPSKKPKIYFFSLYSLYTKI